jgi:membrane protein involved in colicin uptake
VPVQGSEAAAYRAAFETAKEAGLDDEAAKDAAEVAVAEARKARKGGSPSEGIAAAESKTRKEPASKKAAAQSKDREDKKPQEDKTREDYTVTDNASEEDVTEDTHDEVAASGEDGETGGEDVQTTPAGSRAPLLLGGVGLLAVGGYAGLRFVQSWSLTRARRLLRN